MMTMHGKSHNHTKLALLFTTLLAAAPMAANADAVTYDFTGTVTSSNFASVSAGMAIVGSYTIDFANANPLDSVNGIGANSHWEQVAFGGSAYGLPVPNGNVFSSTANVGLFSYASSVPSVYGSSTIVVGNSGDTWNARDMEYTNISSFFTESDFMINGSPAYSDKGMPLFGAGSTGNGSIFLGSTVNTQNGFEIDYGPKLNYSIASLTLVPPTAAPEISPSSAASSLTLLFGALAIIHNRRKVLGTPRA